MTGLGPKRGAQAKRAAINQWRRAHPRVDKRCTMQLGDGTRCPRKSAGPFGYCAVCWQGGDAVR